jgi:radical SAM protein (TIGR04043 family)
MSANSRALLADLQALGVATGDDGSGTGRRGGAGPSDHRALSLGDSTVMVPMRPAGQSPFRLRVLQGDAARPRALLMRDETLVGEVELPAPPRFYALATAEGVPYWKIALLHSRRVLASTVLQTCVRYVDADRACRFCAIGTSLAEGRTVVRKTPAQLAEVAEAAVRLDAVEQVVLTTGTPATADRGAAHLSACAAAIKEAVPGLPVQAQCEPPEDFAWFARLRAAGVDALGMHLEAVEPAVRAAVMPGKAEVPIERYLQAFAAAVAVFGRGQVSTYLIAGLGDQPGSLVAMADRLLALGVYPFLVPFVPLGGTPLANRAPPSAAMMRDLYQAVGRLIRSHGVFSRDAKAGCARCGACSALSSYENEPENENEDAAR